MHNHQHFSSVFFEQTVRKQVDMLNGSDNSKMLNKISNDFFATINKLSDISLYFGCYLSGNFFFFSSFCNANDLLWELQQAIFEYLMKRENCNIMMMFSCLFFQHHWKHSTHRIQRCSSDIKANIIITTIINFIFPFLDES